MTYGFGSTCSEELVAAPFNCCGLGPLINHANRGNCNSLKLVVEEKIRILIYAGRLIKAGEELLYNYNGGSMNEYDTEGVEDYLPQ